MKNILMSIILLLCMSVCSYAQQNNCACRCGYRQYSVSRVYYRQSQWQPRWQRPPRYGFRHYPRNIVLNRVWQYWE